MTRDEIAAEWKRQRQIDMLENELQRIGVEIGRLLRRVGYRPHLERGIAELRHQKRDREIRIALAGR